MGITYDDSGVEKAFLGMQRGLIPALKRIARRWQVIVGAHAAENMLHKGFGGYFRGDMGEPGGPLQARDLGRTGLMRSLQATAGYGSYAPMPTVVGPGVVMAWKGSYKWTPSGYLLLPIHETGARVPVTDRSRKYFWFRYYTATNARDKEIWRSMAITNKTHFYIPARPVLVPALQASVPNTNRMVEEEFGNLVRVHFGVA